MDNGQDQQYTQDVTENFTDDLPLEQQPGGQATDNAVDSGEKINASKNDDDSRKIFVGGLSWETTVKDLREYFAKYGPVADCTLKTDPNTGRSRGFGFVLFEHPTSVDNALAEAAHTLHGRQIDPKRAKARGGREPIKKVFVGGLDPSIPEADVKEYFSKYGQIEEIDLPYDKTKGQRRAFCFITFESEEVVDKVCEVQRQKIGEKEVDVKKATPKDQQGFAGRGGFGAVAGRGFGGRGRGRGANSWGQGSYSSYDQSYGSDYYGGYGNYDYNSYYGQGGGGWGSYGQGSYGGYGGGYSGNQQSGNFKAKRGGMAGGAGASNGSHGYHPYTR